MCTPGTRAGIVHDYTVARAARLCSANPNARLEEIRQLYVLVLEQKIAIRFKKLDEELHSRNQPTQQVKDFRSQLQLDGIEAPHNLEAGYVLDKLEKSIRDVHIVCPNGSGIFWDIELSDQTVTTKVADIFERRQPDEKPPEIREKRTATVTRLRKSDEDKS